MPHQAASYKLITRANSKDITFTGVAYFIVSSSTFTRVVRSHNIGGSTLLSVMTGRKPIRNIKKACHVFVPTTWIWADFIVACGATEVSGLDMESTFLACQIEGCRVHTATQNNIVIWKWTLCWSSNTTYYAVSWCIFYIVLVANLSFNQHDK